MRAQRKMIKLERKTNDEKSRVLLILCVNKKLKAHILSDVSFEYSDIMYMLILDATYPLICLSDPISNTQHGLNTPKRQFYTLFL
jgi:hypothetical protein